jgi:Kef-type K+ transport system membrane component KefB
MSPFLQFDIALVVIIVAAKLGGYVSYRMGQPSVLGELVTGILLGPSAIGLLDQPFFTDPHLAETIAHLAELGVILLMFLAGLDLHISELAQAGKTAALAGVLGVVFPLSLGTLVGLAFQMGFGQAFFIGLVLSATSVSISAQTLMELKVLRSRVGISLLGAAVFDDVLVVLGLSIFVALTQAGGLPSVIWIFLKMMLYLGGAYILGAWLLPRLSIWIDNLAISRGLIAFSFVAMLLYAWGAEAIGSMAAITGGFLAGLVLSRSRLKERIESGIATLAYGVFVPIFFVNVGLTANTRQLTASALWLFLAMLAAAIVGKVLGSGLGAWWSGFSRKEALQMGVGMMSRGEVGLIVASVGVAQELVTQSAFAAIVGVVILTTLLTPPSLRYLFRKKMS